MTDNIQKKLKIAVLLLDDLNVENYGDFADLGIELMCPLGKCERFDYYNKRDLPRLGEHDVIYLTGSRLDSWRDNEFNDTLMEFIRSVFNYNTNAKSMVKILGICFGHQIIARALGYKTGPNPLGWEVGQVKVNGNIQYTISMVHRDIVFPSLDNTFQDNKIDVLGETDICKVQGLAIKNQLLTFQGHPEFNRECTLQLCRNLYSRQSITLEQLKDVEMRACNTPDDKSSFNIIQNFVCN